MKKVQVLGPGCAKCEEAYANAKAAIAEVGVEVELVKVSDFQEIAMMGVFSTPAVVVDGVAKAVGRCPSKDEIKSWL